MHLKFFKGVKTEQQANERYRSLAMQLHPDAGGNQEEWNRMVDEYRNVLTTLRMLPEISSQSFPGSRHSIRVAPVPQKTEQRESFGEVIRETGKQILGVVAITAIERIASTMGSKK